jgi:NTP pyrophosphatase (non-canonical NTP hydrolase)
MQFNVMNDYQEAAHNVAVYPGEHRLYYAVLGLCGESGEVAELVKKALRAKIEVDKDKLAKELGDVLWYLSEIATQYGLNLGDIAGMNLVKLRERQLAGTLAATEKRNEG